MLNAGIIGLGKMGLSHQSILNTHPDVQLKSVCDTSQYVLDVLSKYTGVSVYKDYREMLDRESLDFVVIATPSRYHPEIVSAALLRDIHVFCEKPFALDPEDGFRLADLAEQRGLVNQVGYHYRYVATFNEAKRLLDAKLIGDVHHFRVEAFGPVVLRPKGGTWRSQKSEGGGCLYDYSCHAIDLMDYLVGRPVSVAGTVIQSVFSSDVDDEIYATFRFANGASGQLATNWSDPSFRKMSIKVSIWGTNGRIDADRQEIQVYLRSVNGPTDGYNSGWNVRYTTHLTKPVWFYVRGEEYSAQVDHFVQCVKTRSIPLSTFRTASDASLVAMKIRECAAQPQTVVARVGDGSPHGISLSARPTRSRSFFHFLFGRGRSEGDARRLSPYKNR